MKDCKWKAAAVGLRARDTCCEDYRLNAQWIACCGPRMGLEVLPVEFNWSVAWERSQGRGDSGRHASARRRRARTPAWVRSWREFQNE
eukprot:6206629-Pleurochrysis_carterae.AAC.5